jgi:hypothetical protein
LKIAKSNVDIEETKEVKKERLSTQSEEITSANPVLTAFMNKVNMQFEKVKSELNLKIHALKKCK